MNDTVFIDANKYQIPSVDLVHQDQKVAFAYRSMEYIYDRTGGKPDVPHRHNYYTVLWTKQACGKHFVDYHEYEMAANTVFFVTPGQVHQVITHSKPSGLAIMFTCDFLLKNGISHDLITNLGLYAEKAGTPPLNITPEVSSSLEIIGNQIAHCFDTDMPYKEESIGAWLKLFLIECNKLVINNLNENPQSLHAGRQLLFDFKQLVEKQFQIWHKVSDYASALAITPDYLNNVIKSAIGVTAKDFIQNRIVVEAKRMGVHTHLTSKEIAYSLGFDDPAHFSKFYKNITGASFSDFRAELVGSLG
jgi:AraC-like DNA-binding protein